jgi:mannose-6-phosphate isomerase-like protein (cupin superfamily)
MFQFLYDTNYIAARNNEDYYHFGHVKIPTPSWDQILLEFDREYQIHLKTDYKDIFKVQDKFGFVLHRFEQIPVVGEFLKQISRTHNVRRHPQNFTALAYISLSAESATYGRHHDVMDVWCWQMTGHTLWKVEGRKRNFEKVLEPGELIYVPRGMWHDTKPMTPRAGLSFGCEDLKKL